MWVNTGFVGTLFVIWSSRACALSLRQEDAASRQQASSGALVSKGIPDDATPTRPTTFGNPRGFFKNNRPNGLRCDILKYTYIYNEACGNVGEGIAKGVLITGLARSGTGFLSHFLKGLGLKVIHDNGDFFSRCRRCEKDAGKPTMRVGHEECSCQHLNVTAHPFGVDGSASYVHAFRREDCEIPVWSYQVKAFFLNAFLVVRHPLMQIASVSNNGRGMDSNQFSQCLGEWNPDKDCAWNCQTNQTLLYSLRNYVGTVSFVEQYADYAFRVEDMHDVDVLQGICKHSKADDCSASRMEAVAANLTSDNATNAQFSHKLHGVTWAWLGDVSPEYTAMAQIIALRYGYHIPSDELLAGARSNVMSCNWDGKAGKHWACRLSPKGSPV